MKKTFYQVLGVERASTQAAIDAASTQLTQQWETKRRNGDPTASNELLFLRDAYKTLSDPAKRAEYDSKLPPEVPPAKTVHLATIESLYEVLAVEVRATKEEIDTAFQRSVERWKELQTQGNVYATGRIAALEDAHAILSDPERRQEYDRKLHAAVAISTLDTAPIETPNMRAMKPRATANSKKLHIAWLAGGGVVLVLLILGGIRSEQESNRIKAMQSEQDSRRVLPPADTPDPATATQSDGPVDCTDLSLYAKAQGHNFIERAAIVNDAKQHGRCK